MLTTHKHRFITSNQSPPHYTHYDRHLSEYYTNNVLQRPIFSRGHCLHRSHLESTIEIHVWSFPKELC